MLHSAKHTELEDDVARFLATCRDPQIGDPQQAVALAKKHVATATDNGVYWNTLGLALYRAGDWLASVAALEKSMQLRNGGDSHDFFFLAMAYRQLGDPYRPGVYYLAAVQWMDQHKPHNAELRQFREEASALLGVGREERGIN
jgi:uncharacterized protein HemY